MGSGLPTEQSAKSTSNKPADDSSAEAATPVPDCPYCHCRCHHGRATGQFDCRCLSSAMDFFEHVAHRGRTPVSVIAEFARLLRDEPDQAPFETREHIADVIGDRAYDLGRTFDELLDVIRLITGCLYVKRVPCGPDQLLREMLPAARRKAAIAGIQLETDFNSELPEVYCDLEQASRAISTLVDNAISICRKDAPLGIWSGIDDERRSVKFGVFWRGACWNPGAFEAPAVRARRWEDWTHEGHHNFNTLPLAVANELIGLNLGTINMQSGPHDSNSVCLTLPVWDVAVIADAFLGHVIANGGDSPKVSLVIMKVDGGSNRDARHVENWVSYSLPAEDVLLPLDSESSLMLLRGDENDAHEVLQRVRESVGATAADASLQFALPQSWDAVKGQQEFRDTCRRAIYTSSNTNL